VRAKVAEAVGRDTAALLAKLREELGQADRAVAGAESTLAALARAQVDVLVVGDDAEGAGTAFFGPVPTQVGRRREEVTAPGVEAPRCRHPGRPGNRCRGSRGAIRRAPRGTVGGRLRWA
jgi:hypothetical protein